MNHRKSKRHTWPLSGISFVALLLLATMIPRWSNFAADPAVAAETNKISITSTNATPGSSASTNAPTADAAKKGDAKPGAEKENPDEIQLTFQGANIDMIVQWLAQTSGKTVMKHPRVQCQLTITGSKKISKREALNLVYRALSLEGFNAIETSKAILIVPEGSEPKMSPELLTGTRADIPEGRQRMVKIFDLKHVQAADLKERIKGLLSEKATSIPMTAPTKSLSPITTTIWLSPAISWRFWMPTNRRTYPCASFL